MKAFNFNNPQDWIFEGAVYLYVGNEETAERADEIMLEMAELNGVGSRAVEFFDFVQTSRLVSEAGCTDSRFWERGTCDHCGAHFNYGALYRNNEGEVAVVGNICASNKLNLTAHEYADAKLRSLVKAARSKIKADKVVAALVPNRRDALDTDHYIVRDIRANLRRYHSLSLKQWALVKKIAADQVATAKAKAEESDPEPVVEGKGVLVEGVLLGLKTEPGYARNTYITKMLVRDDRNFKVWGTYPVFADDQYPIKGDKIRFVANIEVSDKDSSFGFFKRPRKAVLVSSAAPIVPYEEV